MIPHGGDVVICDGRAALVLRNEGAPRNPDLRIQRKLESRLAPPTREQGTDRRSRVRLGGRCSPIEQADSHDLAESRFANEVAQALDIIDPIPAVVLVASPSTRAEPG